MKKLLILMSFVLIISGCKKEGDDITQFPAITTGTITGTVEAPTDVNYNVDQLSVHSAVDQNVVVNAKYSVKTFLNHTTILLAKNNQDKVLLMGLADSNQLQSVINVRSTAKALIACTPIMISLDPNISLTMTENAVTLPEFELLENEIKNNLISEDNLVDSPNQQLYIALGNVVDKLKTTYSSRLTSTPVITDPVRVTQEGRLLNFSNNHIAYTTVVGIYKGDQRVKKIIIKGDKALPTSFVQIISGVGLLGDGLISDNYNLDGDGTFEVKIRTGRPLSGDNSEEGSEALKKNVTDACLYALQAFIPFNSSEDAPCYVQLAEETLIFIDELSEPEDITVQGVILLAFQHTVESAGNFFRCVFPNSVENVNESYFGSFGKLFKIFKTLDTALAAYGNVANLTFLGTQWTVANPVVDLCYTAQGNNVQTCCNETSVTDVEGNVYQIASTGGKCWMQTDLNVTHFNDGQEIPQVDPVDWNSTTTPAWCNGASGKLYNYAAVIDPRLPPAGWHVINASEANQILSGEINFSTSPTGFVLDCDSCGYGQYIPSWTYWWAGTEYYFGRNPILAFYAPEFYFPDNEFGGLYYQVGCAVRCVKD